MALADSTCEESHSLALPFGGTPLRMPHHFPSVPVNSLDPLALDTAGNAKTQGSPSLLQTPTMGTSHSSKGSFSCTQQSGQFGENKHFFELLAWLLDSGSDSSDFLGL